MSARHAPWQTLASREIFAAPPWVRLSVLQVQLPDGRVIDDYYQLRLRDYAGVVARTPEGAIVMQRQYKHGVGRASWMLPGGMIEGDEAPLVTAQRELLEETGYQAENWEPLGSYRVDANCGAATAHLFMAQQARQVTAPHPGDLEEMETTLMTLAEIRALLRTDQVAVLGAAAALALAVERLI